MKSARTILLRLESEQLKYGHGMKPSHQSFTLQILRVSRGKAADGSTAAAERNVSIKSRTQYGSGPGYCAGPRLDCGSMSAWDMSRAWDSIGMPGDRRL